MKDKEDIHQCEKKLPLIGDYYQNFIDDQYLWSESDQSRLSQQVINSPVHQDFMEMGHLDTLDC